MKPKLTYFHTSSCPKCQDLKPFVKELEQLFEISYVNTHENELITEENNIIVDGTMLIRELNEMCNLKIKITPDAMTVNGLVLKTLHSIPKVGVCFKSSNLIFEIINMGSYWVERVKITILDPQ